MRGHGRVPTRPWMLPVGVVALIAGHVYGLAHVALSATVVSGVIILMVIQHLGLLAVAMRPLLSLFRRRSRQ